MNYSVFFTMALFTMTLACAPTSETTTPTPARKRREAKEAVLITAVSKELYDEENNKQNMDTVRKVIADYAKKEGITYDTSDVVRRPVNQGGKFAVEFDVPKAECGRVVQFVKGVKGNTDRLDYALVKCSDSKVHVI